MLYCNNCDKEVVIYGCFYSAEIEENLEKITKKLEEEGKQILYNPPPLTSFNCPKCFKDLEEKEG